MDNCTDYDSLCSTKSVVIECSTTTLPVPDTETLTTLVSEICGNMTMTQCSKCNSLYNNCDLLTVYSNLCKSMPYMTQCVDWNQFCDLIPRWSLCSYDAGDSPPPMRMYFHLGFLDYVLFEKWVPRNKTQYIGTWLGVFIIALLYEVIKVLRWWLEQKWEKDKEAYQLQLSIQENEMNDVPPDTSLLEKNLQAPFYWSIDFPRALMHALEVFWGLIVMLIAMTFNVGLFASILAGAFTGSLVFGRFLTYKPRISCH